MTVPVVALLTAKPGCEDKAEQLFRGVHGCGFRGFVRQPLGSLPEQMIDRSDSLQNPGFIHRLSGR